MTDRLAEIKTKDYLLDSDQEYIRSDLDYLLARIDALEKVRGAAEVVWDDVETEPQISPLDPHFDDHWRAFGAALDAAKEEE